MVTAPRGWDHAWSRVGLWAGAIYLVVLPVGHVTAIRSLSLVAAIMAFVALWTRPSRRAGVVLATFAVWFSAAAVSLWTTRDFAASVEAIENDVLRSFIVFLVFYTLTRRIAAAYSAWVFSTAAGFAVLSGLAIYSFAEHGAWQAYYVPALQNFSTAAIIVLPLIGGQMFLGPYSWKARIVLGAAVVITLAAGYLTLSRAFWLVVVCGITLTVGLSSWRAGRLTGRAATWLILIAVAGIAAATLVAAQKDRSVLYLADRAVIYSAAIEKIRQNPMTGAGYGHETDAAWYAAAIPDWSVFHPHNIVLSFVDQMGFFGAVALVAIFGVPAAIFVREMRSSRALVPLCGLVLLFCVFLRNSFDYLFIKENLWLFFAHLGIYLGEMDRSCASALTRASSASPAVASLRS